MPYHEITGKLLNAGIPLTLPMSPGVRLFVTGRALYRAHFRQQARTRGDAIETHFARRHTYRGHGNGFGAHGREIGQQLRMRRPLGIPVARNRAPALVVENGEAACTERVEPIDAHTQLRAGQSQHSLELDVPHGEGCTFAFQLAQ